VPMPTTPVDLPLPGVGRPADRGPIRLDLSWAGRDWTVWMVDVGLACCSVEVMAAALASGASRTAGGLVHAPDHSHVDVLVVSGTCTDVLAPAVRRMWEQLPEPRRVVSFGACASSGGPYWDSYSVTKGIDQLVPVDVYVPGCPPRPEALLEGLSLLDRGPA
jgi:NADH-quinone oxidoreductase subunit B